SFFADAQGKYQVSVQVTSPAGFVSDPAYLQVSIDTCGKTPMTWSGAASDVTYKLKDPDIAVTYPISGGTPYVGASVTLTGNPTNPNDLCGPKNTQPYSWHWAIVSAPSGSRAALTSATDANPSFAPDVP